MSYLLHIMLALGAVALADIGEVQGLGFPVGALGLASLPHALGVWTRQRALRGSWRAAALGQRALTHSAPALQLLAVGPLGWHAAADGWTGAGAGLMEWPGPGLLLSLLPYVVYELAAIDARARLADESRGGHRSQRGFQTRMFLASILPLVAYAALCWLVTLNRSVQVHIEQVGLYGALFAAALVAVFAALLPHILCRTWDTAPMEPGPVRERLEAVARSADFGYRELRLWRTEGLMPNAAIMGLGRRQRVVLFTDALLAQLDLRQLGAVLGHEIGHARRGHVLVFVTWTLGLFMGAGLAIEKLAPEDEVGALLLLLALLVSWSLGFGYLSRRFEHDADLYALELTQDPGALAQALERVAGAHARRSSGWRHFSTCRRVIFLRAASRDSGVGRRLRRSLRRWTVAGALVFASSLTLQAAHLWESFEGERVLADLALGRYGAAAARVRAGAALDPELAAALELGRALEARMSQGGQGPALAPLSLELEAEACLRRGQIQDARGLIELLSLRGHPELEAVAAALDLGLEGCLEDARAAALRAPPGWRPALKRWLAAVELQ